MKKQLMHFSVLFLLVLFANSNLFSQINEGFEGATFPPTGWTNPSVVIGDGDFFQTNSSPRTGIYCAASAYTTAGADNYLITPQFTPISNDSIIFYFSQQFTAVYDDSLEIRVSTTGNLPANFTTRLRVYKDGVDYPLPSLTYLRVAISLNAYTGVPIYIAFRHADLDGENIRIDDVSTKSLTPNVKPTANVSPTGSIVINSPTIAPKATFQNVGGGVSGSFNVTYKISPGGYSSTKSTSLNIGESKTITFDSTFVPNVLGTDTVTIYCSAATDPIKTDDTLKTTFTIIGDPNYGSGTGTVSFANSIATGAPSMPEVCWPDYSGGTNLCLDGTNNDPGVFTGSLDDGYWRIGNILPAGYHIRLNGVNYDSIFPGTNGLIGLTNNSTLTDFSPGVLPDAGQTVALYPFWKDLHFVALQGNTYIKYMIRGTKLYVFYLAATYNSGLLSLDRVFFGATIELVNGSIDSKISYQYGDQSKGTSASFVTAVNNNTLADHVIGLQSGASFYAAYRQRVTTLTKFGPIFSTPAGGELAVAFGPNAGDFGDKKCNTLTVTLSLQKCPSDTITVSIYDASSCSLIDTKKAYFTGSGSFALDFAGTEDSPTSYYIKVQQKNSLAMWSNSFSFSGGSASYDFTSGQFQELSGNQTFNGSDWCMISGDVNQDGAIDASDLSYIENDTECGIPGCVSGYPTDLSCDDFVDAGDLASVENNQGFFEGPPCSPAPSDNARIKSTEDRQIFLPEVDKSPDMNVKPNGKINRNNK
ncbi:MAG TPA: choice-of-anchor J domain-containing protein [Ignavibacteria bacterium]|nr:choice-of-anchor J domain-containing protein [Ignavibacteria bacterium]